MSVTELPDPVESRAIVERRLLLVWQDPATRSFIPVGALVQDSDGSFVFRYLRRAQRTPGFRPLASFPELAQAYRFADLPPFFENRVMSPRRPDYPDHLRALDLTADEATPFEMLARTGGARATDTFHVVAEPVPDADGRVRAVFLAHGVRQIDGARERIARLSPGDCLHLRPDPANRYNPRALLIDAEAGQEVGFVPDWMLDIVQAMVTADPDYELVVELANGIDTPPHLQLLCRLEATLRSARSTPRDPDLDYIAGG